MRRAGAKKTGAGLHMFAYAIFKSGVPTYNAVINRNPLVRFLGHHNTRAVSTYEY